MPPARPARLTGLPSLRRSGTVTELLFLYECLTENPVALQPIADRLGLTVQAVSHSFRRLAASGLVEHRGGHYRPTVRGVAWLHEAFGVLTEDLERRSRQLHVIRSTPAVALDPLEAGESVSLSLQDGTLVARRGRGGPSRGTAAHRAGRGSLVRVEALEGILPLPRGRVHVLTLDSQRLNDPALARELRGAIRRFPTGLLAAPSLEAYHVLSSVVRRPLLRFGVGPAALEATGVGVDVTVVIRDDELPRFLEQFRVPDPPPLTVSPVGDRRGRRRPGRPDAR